MKADDLKNSILQLAMEGKLVPQDPNDEPASVLLDNILEEKEKLIKEKKIKRNNKESFIFRKNGHFYEKIGKKGETICIDNELPFEIPKNWIWYRLNVFANIIMGQSPKGEFVVDNGEGIEFHQGKIFFGEKFLNKSDKGTIKPSKLSPRNSILLCVRAPVGVINICDREICIGRGLTSIKPFIDDYFNYLYYFLLTQEIRYKSKATGSTFKAIKKEIVENTLIPVPPLNEQIHIIDKIEALLPLINEYGVNEERLNRLNKDFPIKLRNSILQEAIQGKLVPQDPNDEPASILLEKIRAEKERLIKEKKIKRNKNESYIFKENNHFYEKTGKKDPICIDEEIPFYIPDSWEWGKLENLIELISGRDLKKTQYNDLKQGIPYVTGASNIINGQLLINRWTDEPAVIAIKNDILLSCKGTIGKILILNEDKVHIARQIMSIRLIDENLINKDYIVIFLMYYVTNLINIAKSMIPGISREDVLKINIPLPPIEEQKRIVEKIDLLFEELNF